MDRPGLEASIAIAVDAHSGQIDRGGKPYILHPLRVMMAMASDDERIVAMLHDVVEDSDWTLDAVAHEFGPRVAAAVDALTKRDGEEYDAYLGRVEANPIALRVKLADLQDNSDMTRLERATEKDWERYRKYQLAISRLMVSDFARSVSPSEEKK